MTEDEKFTWLVRAVLFFIVFVIFVVAAALWKIYHLASLGG
jgi:heme/copper-type cytochrome/quinol oxidase subunit 4